MKMRVFIADDSRAVREWLRRALEKSGAEIVGYAAEARALSAAVRSLRPDVVILDLKAGGAEVAALPRLKAGAAGPVVVVVFANRPSSVYKKRCVDAGADFFFDKSAERKELVWTLEELARRRREARV